MTPQELKDIHDDLASLINRHSLENGSNTPDYLLADYLMGCFQVYNETLQERARWHGRMDVPGRGSMPYPDLSGAGLAAAEGEAPAEASEEAASPAEPA